MPSWDEVYSEIGLMAKENKTEIVVAAEQILRRYLRQEKNLLS